MDIRNKSEQEAGEEFSASSGNYVFTWTSRAKVNRRQGKSSLLAQVTCVHMDIRNKSEQEAGEEFSASPGNFVFTWTSRAKVNRRQGGILC